MKITSKDLHTWIMESTTIGYRGGLYRAFYNGRKYFIKEIAGDKLINFYKKSRGVYGLETNRQ